MIFNMIKTRPILKISLILLFTSKSLLAPTASHPIPTSNHDGLLCPALYYVQTVSSMLSSLKNLAQSGRTPSNTTPTIINVTMSITVKFYNHFTISIYISVAKSIAVRCVPVCTARP